MRYRKMHFLDKLKAWCERQLAEIAAAAPYPLTEDEWAYIQRQQALKELGELTEEEEEQLAQQLGLARTEDGELRVREDKLR